MARTRRLRRMPGIVQRTANVSIPGPNAKPPNAGRSERVFVGVRREAGSAYAGGTLLQVMVDARNDL